MQTPQHGARSSHNLFQLSVVALALLVFGSTSGASAVGCPSASRKALSFAKAGDPDQAVKLLIEADGKRKDRVLLCLFNLAAHSETSQETYRQLGVKLLEAGEDAASQEPQSALQYLEGSELAFRRSFDIGQRDLPGMEGRVLLARVLVEQMKALGQSHFAWEIVALAKEYLGHDSSSVLAKWAQQVVEELEPMVTAQDAADQATVVDVDFRDPGVTKPKKLSAKQAQYTVRARSAFVQGAVVAKTILGADGQLAKIKILSGLPMGLSASAVQTLKTWKFEPTTVNGKPVPIHYTLTVNFRLQ